MLHHCFQYQNSGNILYIMVRLRKRKGLVRQPFKTIPHENTEYVYKIMLRKKRNTPYISRQK